MRSARAVQVYHPCVLLAKKRYVGFMYETPQQTTPTFDAKGIETVRRDTCGAVAKMMERTLRILFTTKDLSQVGQQSLCPAASGLLSCRLRRVPAAGLMGLA